MLEFLARFPILQRIFGPRQETRCAARDRLRLVLVSDRSTVAPHLMESLRNDLIDVISRYMEIDTQSMKMGLERREGAMALAASIPVRSVHRSSAEMPAVKSAPPNVIVAERQASLSVERAAERRTSLPLERAADSRAPVPAERSVERAPGRRRSRRRHRKHSRSMERAVE